MVLLRPCIYIPPNEMLNY